jgi:hypothetical protein
MRYSAATPWVHRMGWLVLALIGLGMSAGAHAGDRHRSHDKQWTHRYERDHARHSNRGHDRNHARQYSAHGRHGHPPKHAHPKGWHYHQGRYWAPASYRGHYCTDRRHFHVAHYHVAVRDYYEYYYPRYRYHGPHPHSGVASLIISVPLF